MKRTTFLLTVGVCLLALVVCGTWTANGQEPVDELRLLRAENTLLKATMAQRDKEIESLKKEIESSKALTTTLLEKLRAKSSVATTPPVVDPTTPESTTRPQVKQGADLDKWAGFRGLKWGTDIANALGMVLVEDHPDTKYYQREDDKLVIGGAKLEEITYGFYKGRFYRVMTKTDGISNWIALKAAVFAMYGEGNKTNQFIDRWYWGVPFTAVKDVRMTLQYSGIADKASMSMSYVPIETEKEADKAKVAKEAKKDF
jgi:hypothetical protein